MSQVLEPALADKAREALARHAWRDAFDMLSEADRAGRLAPTLARSRRSFGEEARRSVNLKGIEEPVEIVSIGWR